MALTGRGLMLKDAGKAWPALDEPSSAFTQSGDPGMAAFAPLLEAKQTQARTVSFAFMSTRPSGQRCLDRGGKRRALKKFESRREQVDQGPPDRGRTQTASTAAARRDAGPIRALMMLPVSLRSSTQTRTFATTEPS
jgi:hypothetical protein